MVIIDFETRSRCDLKTAGTYLYVSDPSTDILCMALYDTNTKHKQLWYAGEELPEQMRYALVNADLVAAHNAEFDQGIYEFIAVEEYDFPEVPREKWYCTSAQCRVNALPASLDDAAWALGLKNRKFSQGADLIKLLSIPQKDGEFYFDRDKLKEMGEYCMQDVVVTADIVANTRLMTQNEHADWLKTCEINERGIRIDRELATLSLRYADAEQTEIGREMATITKGEVTKHTQNQRIKTWLKDRLGELHPLMQEMTVYKGGKAKLSLDKNIRRNILSKIDGMMIDVDDDVVDMIHLLDEGNMSSVAKFKRMLQRADDYDDRVRGAFVFAGASQTLRYASRGVQLHNMKRDCWSASGTEDVKTVMRNSGDITGFGVPSVMEALAKALRPAIIPEDGHALIVGDWSQIEARCLHWLTDTEEGDEKLELFESGADVYMKVAKAMGFDDRQTGKVAELSCGYQGGYRALQIMARNYGVHLSEAEARDIVERWRNANWWVEMFWTDLERAALNAVSTPGQYFECGMVQYVYEPNLIDGTLLCIMPGDNVIQYPKARIDLVNTPWGAEKYSVTALKAGYKPKADAKGWPRVTLYGGLYCENICQGFAAAILRNALRELPDVIAHVHDEIVMEVPNDVADEAAGMLRSVMEKVPDWAFGLPLAADPQIMYRYGK